MKVKKEYLDVFSSKGQILYSDTTGQTGSNSVLTLGTTSQVLTVIDSNAGEIGWSNAFLDPTTNEGDMIYKTGGITTRLGIGTTGQILRVVDGLPAWSADYGEVNTISNVGTVGVGIYKEKVGESLKLYKINPGSTKITIGVVNNSDRIDIDIDPTKIATSTLNNDAGWVSSLGAFTTDSLTEGSTNKYYHTSLFNTDFATKKLDDLNDVNVGTPGAGQHHMMLIWNNTNTQFELASLSATFTTDDLPVGTTNKYWTQTLFDNAFGAKKLDALNDVNVGTPGAGQDGQVLSWVNSNSQFQLVTYPPDTSSMILNSDGTTSVKTKEVAGVITFNAGGKRIAHLYTTGAATSGERLEFKNDSGRAILSTANTAGTGAVELWLTTQGNGAIRFGDTGTATMTTDPGEGLLVQPGSATGGNGAIATLSGGDTSDVNGVGGNLVLQPGTGTAGNGQVVVPSNYVAVSDYSVITKKYYSENKSSYVVVVNTNNSYTLSSATDVLIQKYSSDGTSSINLPQGSSVPVGKLFILKDGKGDASTYNITIYPNGSEKIDGQSFVTISVNYESTSLIWNGTEWNII